MSCSYWGHSIFLFGLSSQTKKRKKKKENHAIFCFIHQKAHSEEDNTDVLIRTL